MPEHKTEERFWAKVNKTDSCWVWTASRGGGGYGKFWINHEQGLRVAHRVSYMWLVGPIPDDLQLDHLCRNRQCVNPDHLEPVTRSENVRRGVGPEVTRARHISKTHCTHGHPLFGDNLYVNPKGWRVCRECMREFKRRYRARRAAKQLTLRAAA